MKITRVKKIKAQCTVGIISLVSVFPVLAGGLTEANTALTDIKVWAYSFLGIAVSVFMIYKVIMALMEKETWGDVLAALGKSAAAGGVLVAVTWAWGIFGT